MIELASDWKKVELEDDVTVEIKPLDLRSYHKLLAFLMPYQTGGNLKDEDSQKIMLDERLPDILKDIVPGHVRNIEGINLDGKSITPAQFVSQSKLLSFNVLVLGNLMTYSTLTGEEEKN